MTKDLHPNRNAEEAQRIYDSIPSIRERAMMRHQVNNRLPGQRLENAATTPYVDQRETRHVPMTGTHTHDHGAFGHSDADDGIHSHEHTHNGDAVHEHVHGIDRA